MPPQNPYGTRPFTGPKTPEEIPGYEYVPPVYSPLEKIGRLPGDIVSGVGGAMKGLSDWAATGTPGYYRQPGMATETAGEGPLAPTPPAFSNAFAGGQTRGAGGGASWGDPTSPQTPAATQTPEAKVRQGIGWGGPNLGTEEALSGLKEASSQFTPFRPSLEETRRHDAMPQESIAPGSRGMFAGTGYDDPSQRAQLAQFEAARGGLHPDVQRERGLEARRRALPAEITARAQLQGAREAGQSRRDVAETGAGSEQDKATMAHMNAILNTMRGIQSKTAQTAEDRAMLQSLRGLFNAIAEPTTGAVFEEVEE